MSTADMYRIVCFPGGTSGKEPTCQCRRCERCRFDPWVGKIPWSREWQPTPVFLAGIFYGQMSLTGVHGICKETWMSDWAQHRSKHLSLPGTKLVLICIFSVKSLSLTTSYPSYCYWFIQVFIIFLLDYWNGFSCYIYFYILNMCKFGFIFKNVDVR